MNEDLKNKLKNLLEKSGIIINQDSNISILSRKPYYTFIDLKKYLKSKFKYEENNFSRLNLIWKMNIVFSRFIFKYALFAENFLLSQLVNVRMINKSEFDEWLMFQINNIINEKSNANQKTRERYKKLKNKLEIEKNKNNYFFQLKFWEKISVLKMMKSKFYVEFQEINDIDFNKIRIIRNKAVHSEPIIDFLTIDENREGSNIDEIFKVVDQKYKKQFKEDFTKIFNKYKVDQFIKLNKKYIL